MTNQALLSTESFAFPAESRRFTAPYASLRNALSLFFDSVFASRSDAAGIHDSHTATKLKRNFKKNKFFFIPLAVIVLLLVVGLFNVVKGKPRSGGAVMSATSDKRVELKNAIAEQTINKTFAFPLRDEKGKEVSKIKYTIEKAELRDEIIVKGQRATSVKGRTFLIIPIKIQNDFNQPVQINGRDYVRLIVDNNTNEKLAPDIHNDPIEVQAISTKQTRVGFPIDDTAKNLILQVGEIKGDKQNIKLELK